MTQWTIRRAQPSDFLQVAALDRVAWLHTGEPYIADGEHAWRVWCEYGTVLVADGDAPEIAAGALLMFPTENDQIFLHKIMVAPDRRGCGLGTALMRAGLESAARPVLLTVDPENQAAVKLYENFGFEKHQHVEGYYRPHEHRLVMIFRPSRT
jgi:ribosomal protein S18 acetylase RimI-like enzyme